MKVNAPAPVGHAMVELTEAEAVHVLHPRTIIAFQGAPTLREDKFMDLAGMYRKKKWIRSRIQGPSQFVLGLPAGCTLEPIDIPADSDLMFDFRHVLLYSEGMGMNSRIQKFKTAWITHEWVRMRFSGPGTLGILVTGDLAVLQLDENRPLYVEKSSLVAYPEKAGIKLTVYGNPLASQHMQVQWELTGKGPVLIQTGSRDPQLEDQLRGDSVIKRVLREVLPFGSIYIK
ncbi:AIM24 family protein [Paenibacillus xanthanilyticus]|uniref:AIM24 family protein n=1 Tax=Paenibacillus xanthanilyticus TaxID=1783531 RepID=A0ABV8K8L7_9BACL